MMRTTGASLLAAACLLLAACGTSDQEEVQAWMNEQRAQTKPQVTPIPEPKKYTPQAYTQEAGTEPFSQQKLAAALKKETQQAGSQSAALLAPELNRRKEPLEAYPLDQMSMVGSVTKEGRPYALLKVDKLLYQVKQGDYLGQNYGKITKISETGVALREIVQDAAGEWIERASALQLQEKAR